MPLFKQTNGLLTNRNCCCTPVPATECEYPDQPEIACATFTATVDYQFSTDIIDPFSNNCDIQTISESWSSTQTFKCVIIKHTKKIEQQYGFPYGGITIIYDSARNGYVGPDPDTLVFFNESGIVEPEGLGILVWLYPCTCPPSARFIVIGTESSPRVVFSNLCWPYGDSCFPGPSGECDYQNYLYENGFGDPCECSPCSECDAELSAYYEPVQGYACPSMSLPVTKGGGGSCEGKTPYCCEIYDPDTFEVTDTVVKELTYSVSYSTNFSVSFKETTLPECFDLETTIDMQGCFNNNRYRSLPEGVTIDGLFGCS
jgi:hypothetical protein